MFSWVKIVIASSLLLVNARKQRQVYYTTRYEHFSADNILKNFTINLYLPVTHVRKTPLVLISVFIHTEWLIFKQQCTKSFYIHLESLH